MLRAVVSHAMTKPITETPDVSDLKNGSSRSYTEAMKELSLHQQLLKAPSQSSQLKQFSLDHEARVFLRSLRTVYTRVCKSYSFLTIFALKVGG